jgi:hypothetical protein
MIMTPDTADQVWCPNVRAIRSRPGHDAARHSTAHNIELRDSDELDHTYNSCVSTACAAWRWHQPAGATPHGERLGYCGAFGKLEHT